MYTLGICNDETASACLFHDGRIIAAASEERFSRIKSDSSFPAKSIQYVLREASIALEHVDQIAYAWAKGFDRDLLRFYVDRASELRVQADGGYEIFLERIKYENDRDKTKSSKFWEWCSAELTPVQNNSVFTAYHHEAHAASAALLSPFDRGLVLTADGRGDFESLAVWQFNREQRSPLKRVFSATSSDSLGYFYGRITGMLGFTPMRHEGKITGLAAYGKHSPAMPLMKSMIDFKDGKLEAKLGDFYRPFFQPCSEKLRAAIASFPREDVAAAAQKHLEQCLSEVLRFVHSELAFGQTPLMLAGGVFGNVKATQALKNLPFINGVFVQPQMGDGGLCIGAAALAQHRQQFDIEPLRHVYLGPNVDSADVRALESEYADLQFDVPGQTEPAICQDLVNGRVIGLVRGRMEFGPRALCHRSVLYRTNDPTINDWLNKRMNRTEFMPFAPVIREETARAAFRNFEASDMTLRFMTSTIDCTDEFQKASPAVTHVDLTARPQVVSKDSDLFMWKILEEWERLSGEMSLVNTSFNAHEEPIICSDRDAMEALRSGMIDVLYVNEIRIVSK